ncbi:major facilitator superfamily domain-containing protein [Podospora appendiculata]|uniref:Major facilitator superfamily domain-containing protein n=1 Tax=Podospora appendiculata TaxID=314037 RepID=A0AAE1CCV1_9PEZI|nr:major facilitator superfamily domain-containing protein [Podospora appendiculata]
MDGKGPDPGAVHDLQSSHETASIFLDKDGHDANNVNAGSDGHSSSQSDVLATTKSINRNSHAHIASASATGRLNLEQTISRIRSRPLVHEFTHPLSHTPTSPEQLVDFDGPGDPYRPINWPMKKKVVTTLCYGLVTMSSSWSSSCYSVANAEVSQEFQVGLQVAVLGTSLFLLGFGVGPLLWAPLSEVYGRRVAVFAPMFMAICFSFGSATAKDLQTLIITRFFTAFFAAAPVTNTGGVMNDLFTPAQRGIALAGYAMAIVCGPIIGPIVSAALLPDLGWRWTLYLSGILQAFVVALAVLLVDETYPPILLVYKARHLRMKSGNWALHTKFEEWDVSIKELANKFLLRPLYLLTTPICFLISVYASFCYGIMYMQLGAVPFIFIRVHGWSPFVATLPFICILLGTVLGAGVNVYNQLVYNRYYHANGNRPLPERRLPPMMFGSILFAAGQFVTGWTAKPDIHWIAPCIGLVMFGLGFFTIFQACLNYLVDTFQMYAASAMAATTFLRCAFACAFPLVVTPLYENVGLGPGSSITGGFAVLLVPVPFVFYVFGKRIRASSSWSKASVYD